MTLKHKLGQASPGIPELDAAILRTRHDPLVVWRESDRQDKVLVALERLNATSALGTVGKAARGAELPHLDGLVQTTADKVLAVGREGDRVHAVLVTVRALEPFQEIALVEVPNPDALVERAGGDVLSVGGDGNGRDAILNGQGEDVSALLDIPKADSAVATAGGDGASVASEVQRINVLLVTREGVANLLLVNIPDLHTW